MPNFLNRIGTLRKRSLALKAKKNAGIDNFKEFTDGQNNHESEKAVKARQVLLARRQIREDELDEDDWGYDLDDTWEKLDGKITELNKKIIEGAVETMTEDMLAIKFKEMKEWEEGLIKDATDLLGEINNLVSDLDDEEDKLENRGGGTSEIDTHRANIKVIDKKTRKYLSDAVKYLGPFKKSVEMIEGVLSKIMPAVNLTHDKKINDELKKIRLENTKLISEKAKLVAEIEALNVQMEDKSLTAEEEAKLRDTKTQKRGKRKEINKKLKINGEREKGLAVSYSVVRKFVKKYGNAGRDKPGSEGGRKSRRRRRRRTRKGAKKSKKRRRKRRTKKRKAAKKSRRRRRRRR
jgi:hypothetical protein